MKRLGVFYGTDGLGEEIELLKRIGVLIKGEAVDWFIILCVLVPLSVGTYQRNILWNSELALWKDCVKKSPRKERSHHNLGYVYYELGRWDEASKEFEEALKLNPHYALSVYNLGLISYRKGCVDTAIDLYKKAIQLDAKFPYSFYNLGIAYYQKGLYKDAIEAFVKFVRLKPDYENAHNCLGLAYRGWKAKGTSYPVFSRRVEIPPRKLLRRHLFRRYL